MGDENGTGPSESVTGRAASTVREAPATTFADVDGLETELARLREAVVTPANDSRLDGLGASGLLLHGPAGVGKSHLARAILGEVGWEYIDLDPVDVPLASPDDAVERVATTRETAVENAPCAVLVEDLDVFAPADSATGDGVAPQIRAELRTTLDAFDRPDVTVLLVATAARFSDVAERLRRPGRIDARVALSGPGSTRRRGVLERELRTVRSQGTAVDVDDDALGDVVERTDGFTVAELVEVVERAARRAVAEGGDVDGPLLRETVAEVDDEADGEDGDDASLGDLFGSDDDRDEGADDRGDDSESEDVDDRDDDVTFGRSGDRGAVDADTTVPDVSFDDVGGQTRAKRRLRETIEWPREYPDRFESLDIDTARGILLYGPPGTGKTLLAKAVATETESAFLSVSGPELLDMYVGESERFVRRLFEAARAHAPSVVFIDEIDAVAGRRGQYAGGSAALDSVVNQLLSELDGLTEMQDVVVVGATNRLSVIDPALRRPGRFGEAIEVPPPGPEGRAEILAIHLAERTVGDDVDGDWLVAETDGYTGADLAEVCERAAMNALRSELDDPEDTDREGDDSPVELERAHFARALEAVEPTCGRADVDTGRAFR